jgi:hypothetical protein
MYLRHIVMEKMLSLIDVPKVANRSIAAADLLTLMRPLIDVGGRNLGRSSEQESR